MYKSEVTQFLDELKRQRPHLEEGQREGRARLWERPQDYDFLARTRASRVPRFSYMYWPRKYT